jgi:hypothetical protein
MVFCEVCQINTANIKSHCKSKKHLNGVKRDAKTEEQIKEYHKRYYIEKNLKDKYKEKKKCECCDKMVAKYNWSKHIQTEKHFKKQHLFNNPEPEYVRDRLIKEDDDDDKDPLTIKEIDLSDSDSDDEIGEVIKEFIEEKILPPKNQTNKIILPPKNQTNKIILQNQI